MPKAASHNPSALSSIASNTGARSPGDELMTCKTSAVAVCRSFASFSSRVRVPTCFCRSAMHGASAETLRALGLFVRRPLTGCPLPPRCRISLPSGGSRQGTILCKSRVSCHSWKSVRVKTRTARYACFSRVRMLVEPQFIDMPWGAPFMAARSLARIGSRSYHTARRIYSKARRPRNKL
jgi:hypothetical protein